MQCMETAWINHKRWVKHPFRVPRVWDVHPMADAVASAMGYGKRTRFGVRNPLMRSPKSVHSPKPTAFSDMENQNNMHPEAGAVTVARGSPAGRTPGIPCQITAQPERLLYPWRPASGPNPNSPARARNAATASACVGSPIWLRVSPGSASKSNSTSG